MSKAPDDADYIQDTPEKTLKYAIYWRRARAKDLRDRAGKLEHEMREAWLEAQKFDAAADAFQNALDKIESEP